MIEQKLPTDLQGDWIWLTDKSNEFDKYCYFRKEFSIDQRPRSTELRIAAISTFHLFINGQHIYFGESSFSKSQTYLHVIDISHCIEPGKNLIAISVFNSSIPQYNMFAHTMGGVWAQIIANDATILTTDATWKVQSAEALYSPTLKKSSRGGFIERLNFSKVSRNWLQVNSELNNLWVNPNLVVPISKMRQYFANDTISNMICQEIFFDEIIAKGVFRRHNFSSCCEYTSIMKKPGTYVAEGFFLMDSPGSIDYNFFCDGPYRLYLNGELIRENAVEETINGDAIYHNFKLADFDTSKGEMIVQEGWNHIVVVQKQHFSSYGFTLNLDADPILFQILREANVESLPGWIISGPIKTPLDRITPYIKVRNDLSESYYSISSLDNSAYQQTLKFKKQEIDLDKINMNYIELTANEFITLDLGQIFYAIPQLSIEGSDGDIIDITCGPTVVNGIVEPLSAGRTRNVNTVILDGKKDQWVDFHPRGFRYLMIVAHKVKEKITITNINAKNNKYEFVDSGYLKTNDQLLNQIWITSLNTLRGTIGMKMMDGAERENSQYIADCLIQSQAEFFHRGDYLSSEKALKEFAAIQYESGEMPAMHPSDVRFHLLDFAMLYPEWLRQHYLYTGDKNLIIELENTILLLFEYFDTLKVPGEEVLYIQNNNHEYFIDLNFPIQDGISTAINAFYCRSLISAAYLLDEIGNTKDASLLRNKAALVSNMINNLCWSESRGQFADFWSNDGRSESYSWHTQVLSIYGAIANEEQAHTIIDKLFPLKQLFASFIDDGYYTPYFMYYVLEILFSRGFKDRGLNLLRQFWGSMLAEDDLKTWPEIFGPNVKGRKTAGSNCMGYSVSPSIYLVREIAGVTPKSAGFKQIYFSPRLDLVKNLNLQIPTLGGAININWHEISDGHFQVKIDANYPIEVIPMYDLLENIKIDLTVTDSVSIIEKP